VEPELVADPLPEDVPDMPPEPPVEEPPVEEPPAEPLLEEPSPAPPLEEPPPEPPPEVLDPCGGPPAPLSVEPQAVIENALPVNTPIATNARNPMVVPPPIRNSREGANHSGRDPPAAAIVPALAAIFPWHNAPRKHVSGSVASSSPTRETQHTVPAGVLSPLMDVSKHLGARPADVLAPLGLREADLVEPQTRFSHRVYLDVIDRARTLTAEPAIGLFWGLQMRASVFGHLGFATMAATTLRDAIDLAVQFASLGSTAEGMRLHVEGDVASLVLEEYAEFEGVRDVVTAARMVGLWRIAETLVGRDVAGTAEAAVAEPFYYGRYKTLLPEIRFGCPTTRLLMKAEVLDWPLVTADPVGLRLARDQCTRELAAMSSAGQVVRAVRRALRNKDSSLRSARDVADAMHMSPRTLRRRLWCEGSALSSLLDEERRDRALLLLRSEDSSIARIAERLGYRSVKSFERAFQRWTGRTPASYRRD
jgi:AraC-like DNA-binding protein